MACSFFHPGFPGFGEGRGPTGALTTGWQGVTFTGVPGDLRQCSSLCLLWVPFPACCLSVQLCPLCLLPALPLGVTTFLSAGDERAVDRRESLGATWALGLAGPLGSQARLVRVGGVCR